MGATRLALQPGLCAALPHGDGPFQKHPAPLQESWTSSARCCCSLWAPSFVPSSACPRHLQPHQREWLSPVPSCLTGLPRTGLSMMQCAKFGFPAFPLRACSPCGGWLGARCSRASALHPRGGCPKPLTGCAFIFMHWSHVSGVRTVRTCRMRPEDFFVVERIGEHCHSSCADVTPSPRHC